MSADRPPPRALPPGRIVAATHNPGKLREIEELLVPLGYQPLSAGELGLPEPEETADTYVGNAVVKAVAAAAGSGLPALADDSGLSVDALGGAPGIYSARWAGPSKDFGHAMRQVELALKAAGALTQGAPASFISVLALAWPHGEVETFEGRVEGHLVFPPRGANGFGYDPIFVPEGGRLTFGEMAPAEKKAMNHRARAFARLEARLASA